MDARLQKLLLTRFHRHVLQGSVLLSSGLDQEPWKLTSDQAQNVSIMESWSNLRYRPPESFKNRWVGSCLLNLQTSTVLVPNKMKTRGSVVSPRGFKCWVHVSHCSHASRCIRVPCCEYQRFSRVSLNKRMLSVTESRHRSRHRFKPRLTF